MIRTVKVRPAMTFCLVKFALDANRGTAACPMRCARRKSNVRKAVELPSKPSLVCQDASVEVETKRAGVCREHRDPKNCNTSSSEETQPQHRTRCRSKCLVETRKKPEDLPTLKKLPVTSTPLPCVARQEVPVTPVRCGAKPEVPVTPVRCGAKPEVPATPVPCGAKPEVPVTPVPCGAKPEVPVTPVRCGAKPEVPVPTYTMWCQARSPCYICTIWSQARSPRHTCTMWY